MPRELQFDRLAALDLALDRFWTRGFNDTSIRDLADHLQVSHSSLYNTFGDKRSLFIAALDRYDEVFLRPTLHGLEAKAPRAAIQGFFDAVLAQCRSDPAGRGCFLVNTALELAPHDPGIAAKVREKLDAIESFFLGKLQEAQRSGELEPGQDPRSLASALFASLLGIRVLARVDAAPERLRNVVKGAMERVGRPRPARA